MKDLKKLKSLVLCSLALCSAQQLYPAAAASSAADAAKIESELVSSKNPTRQWQIIAHKLKQTLGKTQTLPQPSGWKSWSQDEWVRHFTENNNLEQAILGYREGSQKGANNASSQINKGVELLCDQLTTKQQEHLNKINPLIAQHAAEQKTYFATIQRMFQSISKTQGKLKATHPDLEFDVVDTCHKQVVRSSRNRIDTLSKELGNIIVSFWLQAIDQDDLQKAVIDSLDKTEKTELIAKMESLRLNSEIDKTTGSTYPEDKKPLSNPKSFASYIFKNFLEQAVNEPETINAGKIVKKEKDKKEPAAAAATTKKDKK